VTGMPARAAYCTHLAPVLPFEPKTTI
jgi:hypothetical protein